MVHIYINPVTHKWMSGKPRTLEYCRANLNEPHEIDGATHGYHGFDWQSGTQRSSVGRTDKDMT